VGKYRKIEMKGFACFRILTIGPSFQVGGFVQIVMDASFCVDQEDLIVV
jgi:hypothetical protein